jgi:hypothetical protein
VTLEVGRINICSFGYEAVGDVRVPSCVLAVSMSDQCDKPRSQRRPTVDDDAAAAAAQFG